MTKDYAKESQTLLRITYTSVYTKYLCEYSVLMDLAT